METAVKIKYILCGVMYLSCVRGSVYEYNLDIPDGPPVKKTYTVPERSAVTLVCQDRFSINRVTWYKTSRKSIADVSYVNGACSLKTDNYTSITLGHHECKGGNFSITFANIRVADQGTWYCTTGRSSSNLVEINVIDHVSYTSILPVKQTSDGERLQETSTELIIPDQDKTVITPSSDPEKDIKGNTGHLILGLACSLGVSILLLVAAVAIIVTQRLHIQHMNGDANNHGVSAHPSPNGARPTEEETRGQGSSPVGHYNVLHAESQDYQHMYGVIAGDASRLQSVANRDNYYLHPTQHDDVHVYTTADHEPGTSSV